MAIFDRAINSYDAHKQEVEVRRLEAETAEAKRLAEKVSALLGAPVAPDGVRLTVLDDRRAITFYFDHEQAHSGEKLMAEMNCSRCLDKCAAEVGNPIDLGRLIVDGYHEGKCMPARVDDPRRRPPTVRP